jgi:ribosome-binding protein aMBF1 (putative translation factor)
MKCQLCENYYQAETTKFIKIKYNGKILRVCPNCAKKEEKK